MSTAESSEAAPKEEAVESLQTKVEEKEISKDQTVFEDRDLVNVESDEGNQRRSRRRSRSRSSSRSRSRSNSRGRSRSRSRSPGRGHKANDIDQQEKKRAHKNEDGRRRPEPEKREGDWTCPNPQCGANVFASRSQCFRCHQPRPGGNPQFRQGDWTCIQCGANCFARRNTCFKCHAFRPQMGMMQYGGYPMQQQMMPPQQNFQQGRPGDWNCPECKTLVFSFRTECRKCGTAKPQDAVQAGIPQMPMGMPMQQQPYNPSMQMMPFNGGYQGYGQPNYGAQQHNSYRPGDWMCGSCNAHNYASRNECFKCHVPRDPNATPAMPGVPPYPYAGGNQQFFQPPHVGEAPYGGGGGGGGPNVRPGDWTCPSCHANVFASRNECFKCHTPKP